MKPSDYQPFDPQVHEYVDGRMSADAERDFARRIEASPELKRQVESLRKALELLHTLPADEPRPDFNERVIGRVREEELAERARKQIVSAPVPIWQHVVQVGLGAAAAALVFALVGVPGLFQPDDDVDLSGSGGGEVARVTATEDDLLPVLADHVTRFESMRRSVSCTRVEDPHQQRELIMLELQYADLERRNLWLMNEVGQLPSGSSVEYQRFITELDTALTAIQAEITTSLQESRPVDMALIQGALEKVPSLSGKVSHFQLSNRSGEIVPESERIAAGNFTDVDLYALVRRAEYRHDHAAVLDAGQVYRTHMKSGRFLDHTNASAVAALLRLGSDREAAERFAADFGDYDEDLSIKQMKIVRGLLTQAEWTRLNAARDALRSE